MGRKNPITYREELLELIINQSPENKTDATTFSKTANNLGLSPVTINNAFLHASAGKEKEAYNILNLKDLEFSGIDYDVKGTSITGKDYSKLSVHFKNKLGQEIYLAWPTAVKFIQSIKHIAGENIPDIFLGKKINPKKYTDEFEKEDKYANTLDEIINNPDKIKFIQSQNERKKVKSLIGLNDAINEASKGLYKDYMHFITSKDFFSKVAMFYKELLLPKGGIIKRIQSQEYLPDDLEKSLILVTKYKKNLTPEIYARNMHKLKAWDELTTMLDAKGHLARYITDLKELAKTNDITGKPANLILTTKALNEEKAVMTMPEILPFLMMYDISGKRIGKGRQEIEKTREYKKDFEAGQDYFRQLFIKDKEWIGGKDKSIPKNISDELEGIVKKQGDAHLKEMQKWMRSTYSSDSIKNVLKTKSFKETRNEISSIVVLSRRKKMKENLGFAIIDDSQAPDETFKEKYSIGLNEFLSRMDDQHKYSHHKTGDWNIKEKIIKDEAGSGLFSERHFETFKDMIVKLRDEFMPFDDELKKVVNEYYTMKYQSMITNDFVPNIQLSEGKRYVGKEAEDVRKIVKEQSHIINKKYETIETNTNKAIKEYGKYIEQKPEKFENSKLNNYFKIEIQGIRFDEKEDFRETFKGYNWDGQSKSWHKNETKAGIGQTLEKIKPYNENHKGKIKISIK